MKDSLFLPDLFGSNAFKAAKAVIESDTEVFSTLVILSGLDPKNDLRYQSLDGIDLEGSDIRGFDFTGCSMQGVKWEGCIRDETTILDDVIRDELDIRSGEEEDFDERAQQAIEERGLRSAETLSTEEKIARLREEIIFGEDGG